MINILHLNISKADLEDIIGIKRVPGACLGATCRRTGDHAKHIWEDEVLLTDKLKVGKKLHADYPDYVFIPLRWYNFKFAFMKVLEQAKPIVTQQAAVQSAIQYAKKACFDLDNAPTNLARDLGFSSYSKFMKMIDENLRNLEPIKFGVSRTS